jgi:hypothetical protein
MPNVLRIWSHEKAEKVKNFQNQHALIDANCQKFFEDLTQDEQNQSLNKFVNATRDNNKIQQAAEKLLNVSFPFMFILFHFLTTRLRLQLLSKKQ